MVLGNLLTRTHGNFLWWRNLHDATRPAETQLNTNVTSRRGNLNLAYKEFVSDKFFFTVKGMYFGNFWQDDSSGDIDFKSRSDLYQMELQGNYEFSPLNMLTFGITGNYTEVTSNIFSSPLGAGGAAYLQDELGLSDLWKMTLGVRYDYQRVSARGSEGLINPKIGLVYNPTSTTKIRLAYGSGFRFPSIGEWYTEFSSATSSITVLINPNLKVERSNTYELGVSTSLEDICSAELSLFRNDFDNLIEAGVSIKNVKLKPNDTTGTDQPVIQFDNVTKARIQGAELGLTMFWLNKLITTEVGYTFTYPEDLSQNSILKFRPRHLFYTSAIMTAGSWRGSVDYRFVSRIERIDDNLVQLAPIIQGDQRVPIHILDIRTSYGLADVGIPVRVGFNVNNVMNYHYVELIGNLAPVRNFTLTLEGIF
jgi:outer membrane receptor protein involved in Fe transport